MINGQIFESLPAAEHAEQSEDLGRGRGFRVERIVSSGQASPPGFWYDQGWDEWVLLLRGSATLQFLDPEETLFLAAGDWVFLPAGRKHRVESTSREPETIWLAVHGEPAPAEG
jgi:cupin 2 domain-containing protein